MVLELIDLLLLDLSVVDQAIVSLVVARHLLLQLLSGPSDLLNLLLQVRVYMVGLFNLLSKVLLVLFHGLVHLSYLG